MSRSKGNIPKIIEDRMSLKHHGGHVKRYKRLELLGQGGFARCYRVISEDSGEHYACKVVEKKKLRTKEYQNKMWSEIQIHMKLDHPNIVRFLKFFEDSSNVYVMIELCNYDSCMALIRKRKFLRESETRFLMHEICEAVSHLHEHCIIHRDLKIGNLLLTNLPRRSVSSSADRDSTHQDTDDSDHGLHVKICDFGLAAKLSDRDEYRITICGTPNYIAPEMLLDSKLAKSLKKLRPEMAESAEDRTHHRKGHSFGVDIWSLGVIMFTFLTGKPPFETKKVESTYQRITTLTYSFPKPPEGCDPSVARQSRFNVSEHAKQMIESVLQFEADKRPGIEKLRRQAFFTDAGCPCPESLPVQSVERIPREKELFPKGRRNECYHLSFPPLKKRSTHSNSVEQSPLMKKDGFKTMSQELEIIGDDRKKTNRSKSRSSAAASISSSSSSASASASDRALVGAAMHSRALKPPSSMNNFGIRTERRGGAIGISIGGSKKTATDRSSERSSRVSPSVPANATLIPDTPYTRLMRHTRVCKILDVTVRYGIGYQLSDGRIGLIFNDATKMIYLKSQYSYHHLCIGHKKGGGSSLNPKKKKNPVRYYIGNSKTEYEEYDLSQPSSDILDRDVSKKLKLATHFSNHLYKNHHCRLSSVKSSHSKQDGQKFIHLCPDLLVNMGEYNDTNQINHDYKLGSISNDNAVCLCRCCHCKLHDHLHNIQCSKHGICLCPDWKDHDPMDDFVFVHQWFQNSRAILFRLSNQTTQILFKEDNTALYIVRGRIIDNDVWLAGKRERDRRRKVQDLDGDSMMESSVKQSDKHSSQLFYRNKKGDIEQYSLNDIRVMVRDKSGEQSSSSVSVCKRFEYAQKLSRQMNANDARPAATSDHSRPQSATVSFEQSSTVRPVSTRASESSCAQESREVRGLRPIRAESRKSSKMNSKRRHLWMEVDDEEKVEDDDSTAKRRDRALKPRSTNDPEIIDEVCSSSSLEDISSAGDSENDESFGLKPMAALRTKNKRSKKSTEADLAVLRRDPNDEDSHRHRQTSRSRKKGIRHTKHHR